MNTALFNISPLLPLLEDGATVLTPNNRLRNQLRLSYSESKKTQIVRSPAIYSLTEWLNLQWEILNGNGLEESSCLILNPIQQQTIWTQVVEESKFAAPSANYRSLVGHLMEAYRNIQLWNISLEEIKSYQFTFQSTDTQRSLSDKGTSDFLLDWISAFEKKLATIQAITPEQSQKIISDAFENGNLSKHKMLYLQSFDDLPPLTKQLFGKATESVQHSTDSDLVKPKQHPQRVGCIDIYQEASSAALWARNILQKEPMAKIGIIVPSLGNDRQLVERAFTEVFEPQFLDPEVARYPLPFNISAGTPLANTPLISNTLLLLKLNQSELTLGEWQTLLFSPFFSDEENERGQRAKILLDIKKRQQFSVSTANVRQITEKSSDTPDNKADDSSSTENLLSKRLQSVEEQKRRHPTNASVSEWIILFQEQLTELGWPGSRTLDSVEYQQANQWYLLLEKLASLDALDESSISSHSQNINNSHWSFSKIFSELSGLAATTHFQPEVKGSPINILGTLEGAGLQFTHSWIMGMNNKDWPPKPNPNPLLPIQLQRQYQLPRASIERENRYAQAITKQLLHSANNIIVSYVTQFEESESLPSALVEHIPLTELSDVLDHAEHNNNNSLAKFYQQLDLQHLNLQQKFELVNCENGPKLFDNEPENANKPVKGGSDILKQQALCPFNAFAKHRLGVRQPDEPTLALTALDKGNIIHQALDLFWTDVQSHEQLVSLTTADIQEKITAIVHSAFSHQYKRDIRHLGDFYYSLETNRFIELLTGWLEFEKERPPFTTIAREEAITADFSGIRFKLQIDRVDKNAADEIILIDYKTGNIATKKLKGPRPEEPQLPLYLLCYPEEVKAIAFAQVKTNDFQIAGMGELADQKGYQKITDMSKEKFASNWSEAKEYFAQELGDLAKEYINGYCPVDFKTNDQFSEHMTPLNRSKEADYIHFYADQHNKDSIQ